MQVGGLGESHDDGVGARAENSRVSIVGQGNVLNFGNDTLSMRGLGTLSTELVRALTERAIGFLCEELWSFCPVEGSDSSNDVLVRHECFPQFLQLDVPSLGVISVTLQVAPVSKLLGPLLAC